VHWHISAQALGKWQAGPQCSHVWTRACTACLYIRQLGHKLEKSTKCLCHITLEEPHTAHRLLQISQRRLGLYAVPRP